MKHLFALTFLSLFAVAVHAQTVTVSGQCISNPVNLARMQTNINSRPAYQGSGTVLGFANTPIYVYWIGAPDNVWVLDFDGQPYFQNTCNNLLPPATTVSSCSWTPVSGQSCTSGTPLSISGTGTLPVSLSAFSGKLVNTQVQLNWKTSSETNNRGYEVQRSRDGINWSKIGFVNGSGNVPGEKTYYYVDVQPLAGINYYRLVQFDMDMQQTISSIVNIDFASVAGYRLRTNHSITGIFQLFVLSADPVEMTVLDMSGKKLIHRKVWQGQEQIDLGPYASGMYLLQLRIKGTLSTEKLIKQ